MVEYNVFLECVSCFINEIHMYIGVIRNVARTHPVADESKKIPRSILLSNRLLDGIENGSINRLKSINASFAEMHENYYTYEWTWAYNKSAPESSNTCPSRGPVFTAIVYY